MIYVYRQSEPGLWTVGHYSPGGEWQPESDHDDKGAAARRVAWLNGAATMEAETTAKTTVGECPKCGEELQYGSRDQDDNVLIDGVLCPGCKWEGSEVSRVEFRGHKEWGGGPYLEANLSVLSDVFAGTLQNTLQEAQQKDSHGDPANDEKVKALILKAFYAVAVGGDYVNAVPASVDKVAFKARVREDALEAYGEDGVQEVVDFALLALGEAAQ